MTVKGREILNRSLEEVIRSLDPEIKQQILSCLTPEEVLSRYTPEERLAGLTLEERLLGLWPPEERERLIGLTLEELVRELSPEHREQFKRLLS